VNSHYSGEKPAFLLATQNSSLTAVYGVKFDYAAELFASASRWHLLVIVKCGDNVAGQKFRIMLSKNLPGGLKLEFQRVGIENQDGFIFLSEIWRPTVSKILGS
jgi:hypothetical protein